MPKSSKCYYRCIKCGIRSHEDVAEDVTFHSIQPNKTETWLRALGLRENTPITGKSKVCSRHFTVDSYKNINSTLKRLKDEAVPHNKYPALVSFVWFIQHNPLMPRRLSERATLHYRICWVPYILLYWGPAVCWFRNVFSRWWESPLLYSKFLNTVDFR